MKTCSFICRSTITSKFINKDLGPGSSLRRDLSAKYDSPATYFSHCYVQTSSSIDFAVGPKIWALEHPFVET
jgi:hypothetical protein